MDKIIEDKVIDNIVIEGDVNSQLDRGYTITHYVLENENIKNRILEFKIDDRVYSLRSHAYHMLELKLEKEDEKRREMKEI